MPFSKTWISPGTFVATLVLLLSSFLLFCIEPMTGKMLLPYLGGVPAVWNTCLFFFQGTLLAGYAYSHFLILRFPKKSQRWAQCGLFLLPFFVLPISINEKWILGLSSGEPAAWWLCKVLPLMVGLPFFALCTAAPVIQKWFSQSRNIRASDPYFLYAASNAGSLLGLISYPLLLEPNLTMLEQTRLWKTLYILLAVLFVFSIFFFKEKSFPEQQNEKKLALPPPSSKQKRRWCLLSFIPSSLVLGTTAYITNDLGSFPLLWVIPLTLYLLTFILAFSSVAGRIQLVASRLLPISIVPLMITWLTNSTTPAPLILTLHLITLFLAALVCHSSLSEQRPDVRYLTHFYLWISIGGALGGAFNVFIAPILFRKIYEYPLVLITSCLFRKTAVNKIRNTKRDLAFALALGLFVATASFFVDKLGVTNERLINLLILALPCLFCFSQLSRPFRFAASLAAITFFSLLFPRNEGTVVHVSRNFFGVLKVVKRENGNYIELIHGDTVHGRQALSPARRLDCMSYYYRGGPYGDVLDLLEKTHRAQIGVIGLGAGVSGCYAKPGEHWTFFEVDPAVIRIARNKSYFSFLSDKVPQATIIQGDGRLKLKEIADHSFSALIVDAFSSDSIPVHLATEQALELYLEKITENGILVFHISNRYLDLKPVFGNLAAALGLASKVKVHSYLSSQELHLGYEGSTWVVMARNPKDIADLAPDWTELPKRPTEKVWTDDYSNLLRSFVLK